MTKLWGGRFNANTDKLTDVFNASIKFDYKLLPYDIKGSIGHVKTLLQANVLTKEESENIINGLNDILKEYENNNINYNISDEDVHMLIERLLIEKIGEVGKKVHTGRSRNDQVATTTRLYVKDHINEINSLLNNWINTLNDLSVEYKDNIMPGLTHLQSAQPITLGFWFDAYKQMFIRDKQRLEDCLKRVDVSPLGSGALAGNSYGIDRFYSSKILEFNKPCENSMDGVSDRDYIVELLFVISLISIHMSKLAEEIILYNSPIYNYITLDDKFSTGSSIMPQKKNPDIAELVRGKSGRAVGNLVQLLTVLKATPLAYNKDFQEDKESLFDSIDNIERILEIFNKMMLTTTFNTCKMLEDCQKGYLNATDLADYLTKKDIPFRDSHKIVGELVKYATDNNIRLDDIPLDVMQQYNKEIKEDIYDFINIENCMKRRMSYGAPGYFVENKKK